ncbi:Antigen peptide transporter 2 [Manis javanica]|nr:Antigen peptide transporter 2 [Manis javanica]
MLRPQERDQGQENSNAVMWRLLKLSRPDLPFPSAAFFFLIVAVLGETFIPYYSGRVTDILGGDFDPDAFGSAIFFMCFFSVGSSLSAGCQGSCFLITMSRINLRIWEQLFSSLLHEDLGFLQETKTGSASGDPGRSGESRAAVLALRPGTCPLRAPTEDAELRAADADAELRTAAGPGQGPHPRWAALLPALLGGCGLLCV